MKISQIDTTDRGQVRQFLDLPFRLYRDVPQWVPPLESDARLMLDRKRHPFYKHSEAAFFQAFSSSDKIPVGRLVVLENKNYNAYNHEKTAFFYLFECENNSQASHALFDTGMDWARQRGLNKILGPKGFTVLDGMGLLVRGFEHRPALGQPYNPAYYANLIEAEGFQTLDEVVSGYLDRTMEFPDKIHQVSELVQRRRGLHIARFKKRGDLRMLVPRLKDLYNGALEGTTGNVPLTDDEAKTMANQLLWFADPRLIKIIMKDEETVGFLFGYPDISAALQRTKGRMFPFGWVDLLLEFRRTKWINLNGAGILEKYRGLGGTAILFSEMYKTIQESDYSYVDIVQIGTENDKMQRELRDLGIDFYKAHRMYQQDIV